MSRSVPVALALSLLGCRTNGTEPVSSSATLVASADGESLYALNVDEGTLARMSVDGRRVTTIPVGSEPTRLTRAGKRLWVTLRGERTVIALDETPDGLVEAARVEVGAEPYGIVATADGSRVYVAVSLEDEVVELDGNTLEELREWKVLDEPRWLSLNRGETSLFVASARDGRFTRIDLDSGRTQDIELPKTGTGHGETDEPEGGDQPVFSDHGPTRVDLHLTVTGDPALSADGDTLAVPVVYADTTTPVVSSAEGEEGGGGGGYASSPGVGIGRFNAGLVLIELDRDGAIEGEPKAVFLGAEGGRGTLRSYPSGVASDPDGRYFVVTMEGSNAALVVDTEPFRGQKDDEPSHKVKNHHGAEVDEPTLATSTASGAPQFPDPFLGSSPSHIGFWDRPITAIDTGHGPRGVAFVGTQMYVHAFLDRSIGWLNWDDAVEVNQHAARDRKVDEEDEPAPILEVREEMVLEESALSDELLRGQRLFYSALDKDITTPGAGVSCSTCHVDGRNDGRTWTFAGATMNDAITLRQTPSLAGKVSETAPFTWDGNVGSVAEEAMLTSHDRMGGNGLDRDQALELAAYIDATRAPDVATKGSTDPLVLEGKALFERADVNCASCHSGPRFTDGQIQDVMGNDLNTPSLTAISASAPYLHDGSAKTLRDVLVWSRSKAMGDTSMLDDHELDALEAYLKSL